MPGTFPRAAITAMSEWMDVRVSRAGAEIGAVTVSVGPTRVGLGVAANGGVALETGKWQVPVCSHLCLSLVLPIDVLTPNAVDSSSEDRHR